jgi:hypothetical protein
MRNMAGGVRGKKEKKGINQKDTNKGVGVIQKEYIIFILICFVCTSVRTTATEWELNCNNNNNNNNNNNRSLVEPQFGLLWRAQNIRKENADIVLSAPSQR